jgi:hypothetical protein
MRGGIAVKTMWIRLEEAESVLESANRRKQIDFAHIKYGSGGRVEFFDELSLPAKKYLSTTRLLRKR